MLENPSSQPQPPETLINSSEKLHADREAVNRLAQELKSTRSVFPQLVTKDIDRLSGLVESGLQVLFLCVNGAGRSMSRATDCKNSDIPGMFLSGGISKLKDLKTFEPEKYVAALEALAQVPTIVAMVDEVELPGQFGSPSIKDIILELKEAVVARGNRYFGSIKTQGETFVPGRQNTRVELENNIGEFQREYANALM